MALWPASGRAGSRIRILLDGAGWCRVADLRYRPAMKLGNDPPADLVLTPLERSVLSALAPSLGDGGAAYRSQCDRAQVLMRSHSGVGFVTRLQVPEDVERLAGDKAARALAVYATHPQLGEPAEFLVQFKAGRLASIEAYCGEGMWPSDEAAFRISPRGNGNT